MIEYSRCCRASRITAEWQLGRVEVEISQRLVAYGVEGVADPLAALTLGDPRVDFELIVACNTACLSTALGALGESLRDTCGSIATVTYRRRRGFEEIVVDGLEARLYSEGGVVLFEYNGGRLEGLEKCLLNGARLVEPRILEYLRKGVRLYKGSLSEYMSAFAALAADEYVKSLLSLVTPESRSCVESIVTARIRGALYSLLAAQLVVADLLGKAVIAYPLAPDALRPVGKDAVLHPPHYGRGAAAILSSAPEEVSLLVSRLTGHNVDIVAYNDGYRAVSVRVEGMDSVVEFSPSLSLAIGIAAGLLYGSRLLITQRAPLDALDTGVLARELEKRGAVLLNMEKQLTA